MDYKQHFPQPTQISQTHHLPQSHKFSQQSTIASNSTVGNQNLGIFLTSQKVMDTPIAGSASSVDRLYLFYADLLDGQTNAEDSKVIQVLRDAFKFELLLRKFTLKQQLKIRNVKSEIDRCVKLLNMLILMR